MAEGAGAEPGTRWVLLEPDHEFAAIFRAYLLEHGRPIEWSPSAREVLRRLENRRVDLVIAGLDGDDIDGFEFLEEVRRMPDAPPIVLCTTEAGPAAWAPETLERLGVARVLVRPLRFEVLLQAALAAAAGRVDP